MLEICLGIWQSANTLRGRLGVRVYHFYIFIFLLAILQMQNGQLRDHNPFIPWLTFGMLEAC